MNEPIRISIVVTSYNQAKFLDATLRSIVEQDYPDKEIIVIDDGSTDDSVDIIRKYEPHLATWRTGPNQGQSKVVATGFSLTTGQVVGWISSDDILSPGALERVAKAVRLAGGADGLFHGGSEVIDEEGQTQEVYFGAPTISWVARTIGPALCLPGTFFGRDVYFRVGGVDTSLKYGMDLDLWMRFLAAGVPFFYIPEIQGKFRVHPLQKGHSHTWLQHCREEEDEIWRRYGMAPKGSTPYVIALWVQRLIRLIKGRRHKTMLFRILRHRRVRLFTVNYST